MHGAAVLLEFALSIRERHLLIPHSFLLSCFPSELSNSPHLLVKLPCFRSNPIMFHRRRYRVCVHVVVTSLTPETNRGRRKSGDPVKAKYLGMFLVRFHRLISAGGERRNRQRDVQQMSQCRCVCQDQWATGAYITPNALGDANSS